MRFGLTTRGVVSFLTVALAALLVGASVGQGRSVFAVIVACLPLIALLVLSDVGLIVCVLLFAYLIPGLQWSLNLPGTLNLLPPGLVLVFLLVSLFRLGRRGKQLYVTPSLIAWISVLMLAAAIRGADGVSLQSLVGYSVGPLLFILVASTDLSPARIRVVIYTLASMMGLQIATVLVQSSGSTSLAVDRIGGTLGRAATTQIGVLMALVFTTGVLYGIRNPRSVGFPAAIAAVPVMIMAEAKAGFFLAALGCIVGLGVWAVRRRSWIMGIAALSFGAIPVASAYLYYYYAHSAGFDSGWAFDLLTSPYRMYSYAFSYSRSGQAGRLEGVRLAIDQAGSIATVFLGRGLGALSSSDVFGRVDPETLRLQTTFGWVTSAGRALIETGVLGLTLFMGATLDAARRMARRLRVFSTRVKPEECVVANIWAWTAIFLTAGFYTSVWDFDAVAFTYWTALGLVVSYSRHASALRETAEETSAIQVPEESECG